MRATRMALAAAVIVWVAFPTPATADPICLAGTASPTGREPCTPCPPGSSQPRAGEKSCTPCRAGTYAEAEGQRTCLPCPVGTRQLRRAATACEPIPARCAPGTYSTSGREPCLPCPVGQAQVRTGGHGCVVCPPGTTTTEPGQARCVTGGAAPRQLIARVAPEHDPVLEPVLPVEPPIVERARVDVPVEPEPPSPECPAGSYSLSGLRPCLPCPEDADCTTPGTSLATIQKRRAPASSF